MIDVTIQELLGEIGHGYSIQFVNHCAWRIVNPDGKQVVSGSARELSNWVLDRLRRRAQISVIREAIALVENPGRSTDDIEAAVGRFKKLGIDPWCSVPE